MGVVGVKGMLGDSSEQGRCGKEVLELCLLLQKTKSIKISM